MSPPVGSAARLVESLAPDRRRTADVTLQELVAWSGQRSNRLAFDTASRDQPHVRSNTAGGNVFWLARPTAGGDAKVEILTRTAGELPGPVLRHLRERLHGLAAATPSTASGAIQIPMVRLEDPGSRELLRGSLDFALGAVVALAGS